MQSYLLHSNDYDALILAYLDALDQSDFEQVSVILRLAEHDPQLEDALSEAHQALYAEDVIKQIHTDALSTTPPQTKRPNAPSRHFEEEITPHPFTIPPQTPYRIHPIKTPAPFHTPFATSTSSPFLASPLPAPPPSLASPLPSPSPSSTPLPTTPPPRRPLVGIGGSPSTQRSLRWLGVSSAFLFCFGLALWLIPLFQSKLPHKHHTTSPTLATLAPHAASACLQSRPHPPQKQWLRGSWINTLQQQPHVLTRLLKQPILREDLLALLQNHRLPNAISRAVPKNSLTPFHRVIRARLFLRMSRFHQKNYDLALQYNEAVYLHRLQQVQPSQLGQHFHYYWGRLRCLQGQREKAVAALQEALQQPDSPRKERIKAWLIACQPQASPPAQIAAKLAKLDFSQDPEGWAEWIFLHHHFRLPAQTSPHLQTQRTQLYARVWQQQPVHWPHTWQRHPIDQEAIEEQGIRSVIDYFDPVVFLMMADAYAQHALRLLQDAPQQDRYAPFLRAHAFDLLRNKSKALVQWNRFLQSPPQKLQWEYLLFSHRHTPAFLRDEACYHTALSLAATAPDISHGILHRLAYAPFPTRALAGLGMLHLRYQEQAAYDWLLQGIQFAEKERTRLRLRFDHAAEHASSPEEQQQARMLQQLQLEHYAVGSLYVWGSIGAMIKKEPALASRWMERLHHKDEPYRLAGLNEPLHFAWTARAYTHAGNLAVATLFFAQNREAHPALTQLWSLVRLWRIFEGMQKNPTVRGG